MTVVCMLLLKATDIFAVKYETRQDAEIAKLGRVLSSMSTRAKKEIPNGDAKVFLADLHSVLASDAHGLLILCDKQHPIGEEYVPSDLVPLSGNRNYRINRNDLSLRRIAEQNLQILAQAAKKDGITLLVSSAYRSYAYQVIVYNRLVATEGQRTADRESARPGTSQHQLGTTVDFGSITDAYAKTAAGKWLSENAEKYGWSLSFPDGYEDVTGYRWECWHYRYIGQTACNFQRKWFSGIQQFMLEFLHAWTAD